jgi:hypothetical protein
MDGHANALQNENWRLRNEIEQLKKREREDAEYLEVGLYLINERGCDFGYLKGSLWQQHFDEIKRDADQNLVYAVERLADLDQEETNYRKYDRLRQVEQFKAECFAKRAKMEITSWLLCSTRLGLCLDMRQCVAKLLWATRHHT